jgi:hypothetical protein
MGGNNHVGHQIYNMDESDVFLGGRGVEADNTEFTNNKRQCEDWKQGKTGQRF